MSSVARFGIVATIALSVLGLSACGAAGDFAKAKPDDPPLWSDRISEGGANSPPAQAIATGDQLTVWRPGGPLVAVSVSSPGSYGWEHGVLSMSVALRNAARLDPKPTIVKVGYHLDRGNGWAEALFQVDRADSYPTSSNGKLAKIPVDVATPTGSFTVPIATSDIQGTGGLGLMIRYQLRARFAARDRRARLSIDYVQLVKA